MKVKTEGSGLSISRITASMARDYLKCPKLFYYRYILRIKLPMKAVQLVFGGAVHDAIQAIYEGQDPIQVFNEKFKKEFIDEISDDDFKEQHEEGHRLISEFQRSKDYFKEYWKIHEEGTSEESFHVWWKNPITSQLLGIPVSGRFDRITKDHQIIEYKTSSKLYKQDEVDTQIQASVYYMSYFMKYKVWPKEILYVVLVKNRKEPIQVLRTTRTKDDLAQAFNLLDLILKSIRGKQFEKGTGFMHRFCECVKYEELLLIK